MPNLISACRPKRCTRPPTSTAAAASLSARAVRSSAWRRPMPPFWFSKSGAAAGLEIAVLPAGDHEGQVGLGPALEELAVDLDRVEFSYRRRFCRRPPPNGQRRHENHRRNEGCRHGAAAQMRSMLHHFTSVRNAEFGSVLRAELPATARRRPGLTLVAGSFSSPPRTERTSEFVWRRGGWCPK